tara:strand:+ start:1296 stop:1859 length:564 start_codon:yes stop_codon:yes gene_type:complete
MAKRLFDILIAFVASIILIIPCVFISILILLTSSGPVIHWSRRIGSYGTYFMMPKFRTMQVHTPEVETNKLSNPKKYITPIGYFLRRTSIDELPQLFSVLIGDMSLVGPRPALYNQYEIITKRKELGIDVLRPGITGWAQVNGRDKISLEEKIGFDYQYLKQQSILFDLIIILKTIISIVKSENILH